MADKFEFYQLWVGLEGKRDDETDVDNIFKVLPRVSQLRGEGVV